MLSKMIATNFLFWNHYEQVNAGLQIKKQRALRKSRRAVVGKREEDFYQAGMLLSWQRQPDKKEH